MRWLRKRLGFREDEDSFRQHRDTKQIVAIRRMLGTVANEAAAGRELEGLDVSCGCDGHTVVQASFRQVEAPTPSAAAAARPGAAPTTLGALILVGAEHLLGDEARAEGAFDAHLATMTHVWGGHVLAVSSACQCDRSLRDDELFHRLRRLFRQRVAVALVVFRVPTARLPEMLEDGFERTATAASEFVLKADDLASEVSTETRDALTTVFSDGAAHTARTETLVHRLLRVANADARRVVSVSLACGCSRGRVLRNARTALVLTRASAAEPDRSRERYRAVLFFEPNQYSRRAMSPYLVQTLRVLRASQHVCAHAISCGCDPNVVWSKQVTSRMPHCVAMAASGFAETFGRTIRSYATVQGDARAMEGARRRPADVIFAMPSIFAAAALPVELVSIDSMPAGLAKELASRLATGAAVLALTAVANKVVGTIEGGIIGFPMAVFKGLVMAMVGATRGVGRSVYEKLFPARSTVWVVLFRRKEDDPRAPRRAADPTETVFAPVGEDLYTLRYTHAVTRSWFEWMMGKEGWAATQERTATTGRASPRR